MKWKNWLLATSSKPSSNLSLLGPKPRGPCLIPRPQHAVLSPSFGNAPLFSLCLQPLPTKNSMSAPLPPSDGQCFLEEAFLITQQWPQFIMLSSLGYLFIVLEPHHKSSKHRNSRDPVRAVHLYHPVPGIVLTGQIMGAR